ncbi:MAG: S8 family serine peptidase [Chitinophagaceae bacterium]|nr:S8 family serine peptidase [Chitinophagaceae bacterium]
MKTREGNITVKKRQAMQGLYFMLLFIFTTLAAYSQEQQQAKERRDGWHLLDPQADGYMGISLEKAYELLKGRKSTPVIVAVIDSGIDTSQEDLREILWKNPREINGNGIDDDKNGYTDDIYGWNFCGSPSGENLARNTYEVQRVYHNWKSEFEGKKEKSITPDRKFLYQQWVKAEAIINRDYDDAARQEAGISNFFKAMEQSSKIINDQLGIEEFSANQVKPLLKSPTSVVAKSAAFWVDLFAKSDDTTSKSTLYLQEIRDYKTQLDNKINRKTKAPEDLRGELVRDKYTDINDRYYGNNNLKSGSGDHGTMVAGTIAAIRHNGMGVDGIADNVRIMALRAVPGGDEHDKDVALAIRYAVDHGARIINMSFGKPVSPYKQFVDDAVRYAASKGVLLVHGSGNDGKDLTNDSFYPNPVFIDGTKANNFLTVGASGDLSTGGYAAPFSNYSYQAVDIFAPGVNIYSTATNNRYKGADGTSLASPVAAGVAALIASYFPTLTPKQIIHVLTTSGKPLEREVSQPGESGKKVKFTSLSSSGRVINAYEAVKAAMAIEE